MVQVKRPVRLLKEKRTGKVFTQIGKKKIYINPRILQRGHVNVVNKIINKIGNQKKTKGKKKKGPLQQPFNTALFLPKSGRTYNDPMYGPLPTPSVPIVINNGAPNAPPPPNAPPIIPQAPPLPPPPINFAPLLAQQQQLHQLNLQNQQQAQQQMQQQLQQALAQQAAAHTNALQALQQQMGQGQPANPALIQELKKQQQKLDQTQQDLQALSQQMQQPNPQMAHFMANQDQSNNAFDNALGRLRKLVEDNKFNPQQLDDMKLALQKQQQQYSQGLADQATGHAKSLQTSIEQGYQANPRLLDELKKLQDGQSQFQSQTDNLSQVQKNLYDRMSELNENQNPKHLQKALAEHYGQFEKQLEGKFRQQQQLLKTQLKQFQLEQKQNPNMDYSQQIDELKQGIYHISEQIKIVHFQSVDRDRQHADMIQKIRDTQKIQVANQINAASQAESQRSTDFNGPQFNPNNENKQKPITSFFRPTLPTVKEDEGKDSAANYLNKYRTPQQKFDASNDDLMGILNTMRTKTPKVSDVRTSIKAKLLSFNDMEALKLNFKKRLEDPHLPAEKRVQLEERIQMLNAKMINLANEASGEFNDLMDTKTPDKLAERDDRLEGELSEIKKQYKSLLLERMSPEFKKGSLENKMESNRKLVLLEGQLNTLKKQQDDAERDYHYGNVPLIEHVPLINLIPKSGPGNTPVVRNLGDEFKTPAQNNNNNNFVDNSFTPMLPRYEGPDDNFSTPAATINPTESKSQTNANQPPDQSSGYIDPNTQGQPPPTNPHNTRGNPQPLEPILEDPNHPPPPLEQGNSGQGRGYPHSTGKPLFDTELIEILAPYRDFVGCVMRDEVGLVLDTMLAQKKYSFGLIFNTSNSNEEGAHWVALFVDLVAGKQVCFYNSFGEPCPPDVMREIKQFVSSVGLPYLVKFKSNRVVNQVSRSNRCGYHCADFLITMFKGGSFKEATHFAEATSKTEKEAKQDESKFRKFGYI